MSSFDMATDRGIVKSIDKINNQWNNVWVIDLHDIVFGLDRAPSRGKASKFEILQSSYTRCPKIM